MPRVAMRLDAGTRGRAGTVGALAVYGFLSFAYFGAPVVAHPRTTLVGDGNDPSLYVWSMAWWPHAIAHGLNPLYPHLVWAPGGVNLAWTASVPGLSLPLAPLTAGAGPEIAYNVAAVLLPALAAWSAYLLCRHLTHRFWPSLAGGYIFGFSSYILGQSLGHLAVVAVFPIPLAALAVIRRLEGTMTRRALVGWLALVIAFELAVSTEVAFTMTLALVAALGLGWIFFRELRVPIRGVVGPVLLSYLVAGVIVSPILWYAFTDFRSGGVNTVGSFPGDLANLVIPTGLIALSGSRLSAIAQHFLGNTAEEDLYLGVPTIVIALWFIVSRRRSATARFLGSALALAVIASLGTSLYFEGRRVAPAPWALVHRLPGFDDVITARLAVYTTLLAAVIVALWAAADRPPSWVRLPLTALAVLVLVPSVFTQEPWKLHPDVPRFFAAGGLSESCLRPGDNVLVLPFLSDALLWQTVHGYRFRLAAPDSGTPPPRFAHDAVIQAVVHATRLTGGGPALVRKARSLGVSEIAVDAARPEPWRTLLAGTVRPDAIGGLLLYRLTPGPTTCEP